MRAASTTRTGTGSSPWLPLDHNADSTGDGYYLKVAAGVTCSVELTPDDVFNPAVTPVAFPCNVTALTGATANVSGSGLQAAMAARVTVTAGTGAATLTVVPKGGI